MSVAPDFLLQSAPDVRPKAPAAKAPSTAPEPSRGEASSFAEVYAKERQAKAAERKEAGSKAAEERAAESKTTEEPAAEAAAEQPAVAESGNTLPEEVVDGGEEEVVDPLLLMAMSGQLPATEMVDPALSGAAEAVEGEPLLQASAPTVASAAPATLTEASHDPELDMLNSLSGVKLALEIGAQNQAAAQQQLSPGAVAAERANNPAQGFANALAAFAGDAMPSEEAPSEGLEGELLGEALDTSVPNLREGQSDARAEAFASKNTVLAAGVDGLAMGLGLTLVLAVLGGLRELFGRGTLFSGIELIFGEGARGWVWHLVPAEYNYQFLLAMLPPGAFMGLAVLVAAKNGWTAHTARRAQTAAATAPLSATPQEV